MATTNKKRKLTHEETWDDSPLIKAWDKSLDEYKQYHSLHVQGGMVKLEDVLRNLDEEEQEHVLNGLGLARESSTDKNLPYNDEKVNFEEVYDGEHIEENEYAYYSGAMREEQPRHGAVPAFEASLIGKSGMPEAVLCGQDEALKNLMMSWYYAGYYTGLYEGKQQAEKPENSKAVPLEKNSG